MTNVTLASYLTPIEIGFELGTVFTDLPTNAPALGVEYSLTVEQIDDDGLELIQSLRYYTDNIGFTWARRINKKGLEPAIDNWGPKNRFKPDQVVVENLTPSYRWKGTREHVSMRTLSEDGVYSVVDPVDLPSGASYNRGYLDVTNINFTSVVIQTWRTMNQPDEIFTRQFPDINNPTGDWMKVGGEPATGFFSGKKIMFIGDDLTVSGGYQNQIKNRLQLSRVINVGFPAGQIAANSDTNLDPFSLSNLVTNITTGTLSDLETLAGALPNYSSEYTSAIQQLIATDLSTIEYLVIQMGQYDMVNGIAVGTLTDTDNSTYSGAWSVVISTLLDKYPQLKILAITPFYLDSATGATLKDYALACNDICGSLSVPVLDLYKTGSFNIHTLPIYVDTGTLTDVGHKHLGNKIAAALEATY